MAKGYVNVDASKCCGCRMCELACSTAHSSDNTVNPKESRIRVLIEHRENVNQPQVCIQCEEHPCLAACPVGAISMDPELDIPIVDMEACIGCRACVKACPYGFMFFDEKHKKALKCDLCGGDPECVKSCGVKALSFETE